MTDRVPGRQWGAVAGPTGAAELTFAEVYRMHYDFVWRCIRRLGVPSAWVDDATQEVFVIVHRRLRDFDGGRSLRSWLFGILRKVAAAQRRRVAKSANPPAAPHPAHGGDPEEEVARQQAADWVERFLSQLDEEQRAVFVLVQCEGVSVVEAAEVMGTKANTAYSRLRLARRRFERALQRSEARARSAQRRRSR